MGFVYNYLQKFSSPKNAWIAKQPPSSPLTKGDLEGCASAFSAPFAVNYYTDFLPLMTLQYLSIRHCFHWKDRGSERVKAGAHLNKFKVKDTLENIIIMQKKILIFIFLDVTLRPPFFLDVTLRPPSLY